MPKRRIPWGKLIATMAIYGGTIAGTVLLYGSFRVPTPETAKLLRDFAVLGFALAGVAVFAACITKLISTVGSQSSALSKKP